MNPEDEAFWLDSTRAGARNPQAWLLVAEDLKRAADVLFERWQAESAAWFQLASTPVFLQGAMRFPSGGAIPMMLAGLALENLSKGTLIARDPSLVDPAPGERKLLPTLRRQHLTIALVEATAVKLDPADRDLVRRLAAFVRWAGRYPVAVDPRDMAYRVGGLTPAPASWSSDDVARFNDLFGVHHAILVDAAAERSRKDELDKIERDSLRRTELLSDLGTLRRETRQGVTVFVDDDQSERLVASETCVACQATVELSDRIPAAICRCGTLRHRVIFYDASRGEDTPRVDSYPARSS